MKANELMVGDLILIHEPDCKGHRIDYISEIDEEVGADGELYPIGYIKPIPLTPEILEKNGFEKTLDADDMECYRYYNRAADGHIKIILHDGGDGDWSIEIVNYDKFHDYEIRYKNEFLFLKVHQLQHALRLCDIEKEIEL